MNDIIFNEAVLIIRLHYYLFFNYRFHDTCIKKKKEYIKTVIQRFVLENKMSEDLLKYLE